VEVQACLERAMVVSPVLPMDVHHDTVTYYFSPLSPPLSIRHLSIYLAKCLYLDCTMLEEMKENRGLPKGLPMSQTLDKNEIFSAFTLTTNKDCWGKCWDHDSGHNV